MKVLVIGSGGREHTLVWKIKQSPLVKQLFCAPGNPGIAEAAELVNLSAEDLPGLKKFVQENNIDLTIVGPENPLALGIVDDFRQAHLKIFGPTRAAAQLEGSKSFAKKFMKKYKIPTAEYKEFTEVQPAMEHIYMSKFPVVIKADGLAAGKGVTVARSLVEAKRAVHGALQENIFGEAGSKLVIEEFLEGEEASLLAFCDGEDFIPMTSAQDHKAVYDEDKGPNTGGMGAYSPAPVVTPDILKTVNEKIFKPVLAGMKQEGSPYQGILYAGLMITKEGPKVIEFNCRFGDPETQAILPRLENDLIEVILACLEGKLAQTKLSWKTSPAVCIVLTADGYPGKYLKGSIISGIADAEKINGVKVFQAGTALENNNLVTSGGRVLGVTALGDDLKGALKTGYSGVAKIKFDKMHFRKDIGQKGL